MAGINLSQSIQEKQALARGSLFDRGFFANIGFFLLVLIIWGGTNWYAGKLTDELTVLQQEVNRIADFRDRLDTIEENLDSQPDPRSVFQELERYVVPTVRLTRFAYQQEDRRILIDGITDNLRYLAQQMLSFKRLSGVERVHAALVEYNKDGKLEFNLILTLSPSEPKTR
jgi:Tfp pilus assembly protein PilN